MDRAGSQRWRVRSTHFAEVRLLRRFLAHFGFSFPGTADTKGIFLVEDTGDAGGDAVAVMALTPKVSSSMIRNNPSRSGKS